MNVLRTGMNMSISHIHIWLCDSINLQKKKKKNNLGVEHIPY